MYVQALLNMVYIYSYKLIIAILQGFCGNNAGQQCK